MSEAERASKTWLRGYVQGYARRLDPFPAVTFTEVKATGREYRWERLDDGREVFRPVRKEYDLRSHLSAPQIARDYAAYQCPITGKPVEGRTAHRENLKKHDCRLLEPGETRDFKKNRPKEKAEKLKRDVHQCVMEAKREYFV